MTSKKKNQQEEEKNDNRCTIHHASLRETWQDMQGRDMRVVHMIRDNNKSIQQSSSIQTKYTGPEFTLGHSKRSRGERENKETNYRGFFFVFYYDVYLLLNSCLRT